MKTFTLKQLKGKLKKIQAMGYVKTIRGHDGGVGNTLDKLLGLTENNFCLPDAGEIEIKAKRVDSSSMLTLMSKSPMPRAVNKKLFNIYSHLAKDGVQKLYTTIYGSKTNPQGFKLKLKGDKVMIVNKKNIEAYWLIDPLFNKLKSKADKILLAYAKTKGKKPKESFHYQEAFLLSGLSLKKFKKSIIEGKLKFDIRIGADRTGGKIGKYHDHGTAIRISKKDFLEIFDKHVKII